MSGPGPQEHAYLKVLHDFQYKTAEGREIIIKKNERLYLLQKTNADWWQVVRNLEQRSFYVPATYVREVSRTSASSTRKNSEEDRDGIFEPPQDPSYKSMPRESSNAMRNVKKWLAGAMDSKPDPPKTLYGNENYQRTEAADDGPRGHAILGSIDHKTKSLERDLRTGHFSDREEESTHESPRPRDVAEQHENSGTRLNRLSTSPKSCGLQFRMEAALQDPFRRELESSLDRRNLGVKGGTRVGTRIRTRSTNSEGSHANSDSGDHREPIERTEREILAKPDGRKMNLSVHEEPGQRRDSESSSGTSRNSRSLDFEASKFAVRRERSVSPKPLYGRQMTIVGGGGGAAIYSEKPATIGGDAASGDHRILNDKRRTWAVEELMSELTQMCKERVVNKKPAFQLKSTEIKSTGFDPHEKLTREIHEMNRLRAEGNIPEADDAAPASPINVCKIAINTVNTSVAQPKSVETSRETEPEIVELRKRSTSVSQPEADQPRQLKSPKSPKILDEYNEANILNDSTSQEGRATAAAAAAARSLSPDKQSPYQRRANSVVAGNENRAEAPCYSNVKIAAERTKTRPKLRIKTMEPPQAELRLTPSLEKLASEIQFLPARRTSQQDDADLGVRGTDARGNHEDGAKSDDSLERRAARNRGILKHRLEYRGSLKREKRDERDEGTKKSEGLRKSNTLHCATIPECYRRFRRRDDERFETVMENPAIKRRSRSLSDLELIEGNSGMRERKDTGASTTSKGKPVPMPRTKIPAVKNRAEPDRSSARVQSAKDNGAEASSPRTLPEVRKISRERRENSQDELTRRIDYAPPPVHFLADHCTNNFGVGGVRNVNIESSTAVGFKTLLCASDSGSDNCLQSKELLRSSTGNLNERGSLRAARKSSSSANFNERSRGTRESLSDEQILSSNASSEALHSHSESEVTATLDASSQQPSPVARSEHDGFECAAIDLPPGWTQNYDTDTGQICFLNEQGDKWFSSNDAEGKIYFFEENSNESSWVLPTVHAEKSLTISGDGKSDKVEANGSSTSERKDAGSARSSVQVNPGVVNRELTTKKPGTAGGDWPHLYDGNNMRFLKEGIINRTKITENGKKLRKNWSSSYAVLTELFLLFFKDAKTFTMMKTGQSSVAKPDISVDLNGALVEHGERASSRKNVYMISTVLGLQVLIQSDNSSVATEWFQEVHGAIRKLPSGFKSQGKLLSIAAELRINSGGKQNADGNQPEDPKRFSKIARSRSMKMKRLDDSLEDLSGSAAERQTKIKAKLRWFFQRRPAVELLVKNGIYKDEPAFGSYLSDVCPAESPRVPLFVKTCIEVLESKEENMKTDGLYRASGNLSQIQKIRLQVDQYKLDVLAQEEDVHVLAGALKLFFRELKEPLIPSTFFKEAVNASMLKKSSTKIQCFRDIVKALPAPNYDTLQFLLKHLLRVTSYQEFNRMHIPNLAIVFGPTLMWPAEESANMALDFMQQNLVIECLLSEYNKIFK